ncbi:hypothetical protein DdX_14312 [Ditylenchus destructor]|uniref:F-box domain-containing protein n=1 Tax=Ditylenchus destructor TaxID=166010 RepID=A0AAD4R1Z6_9BILA|nr:hypothetical protein DdX_14312 [Ditylenchus destructor]
MESKFDDENISLMNHRRIEFPLYTQLDIFKFLRAYDLQKSCINVSKEWRDTIRRYAGELPKFRDQRDRRAIVRLMIGDPSWKTKQRQSMARNRRMLSEREERELRCVTAVGTVLLVVVVTLAILSVVAVMYIVLRGLHSTVTPL